MHMICSISIYIFTPKKYFAVITYYSNKFYYVTYYELNNALKIRPSDNSVIYYIT